ncbi:hypothetical protein FQN60_001251 [Etheostoma spectabile]|uniref:Ig-like domain-containing protein n=1 Tax=Etheostoma spectabile TaxID=54343 RepID=A0A5J5D229_9PERO|nr:hypothetical protein FQN60_001251 [Etheostoma spectabile]
MEAFCKYLGINRTFSLICYMFWIFSPAEGNTISQVVGSKVTLPCNYESNSTLVQLTWKMNKNILFSYKPKTALHNSTIALNLSISMSMSESQMFALVIERVQKSHTGNYTCDINTFKGIEDQRRWDLIITGIILTLQKCNRTKKKIFMKTAWKVNDVAIISLTFANPGLTDRKHSPKRENKMEMEYWKWAHV